MENAWDPEVRARSAHLRPRALVLGALMLLGAGCSTMTLPAGALSERAVRLHSPIVLQEGLHDCGLASLSALCRYWGVELPAAQQAELARTAATNAGLSGRDLCDALEALGLEAYLFHGSLDRSPTGVYPHIDAGRPPLVMVSADGTDHHYALVLGYDDERGNLVLLDPGQGEVLVSARRFEREWARCEHFMLLASRTAVQPTTTNPDTADAVTPEPASLTPSRN